MQLTFAAIRGVLTSSAIFALHSEGQATSRLAKSRLDFIPDEEVS